MTQSTFQQHRTARPGIPEALVGVAVFALIAYGVPPLLRATGLKTDDPIGYGLALGALSGIAGLAAFFVALGVRLRAARPFGVIWPSWRWMVTGVGAGVAVWVVARILTAGYALVFGTPENVQATYETAARGGALALIASTLFLAVLTPVGEEILFRGVVANAMLRWGWVPGILGSALVFALLHGLTGFNVAMVTAFVEGVAAALLFKRTGSIWPGVIIHVTNNVIANILASTLG